MSQPAQTPPRKEAPPSAHSERILLRDPPRSLDPDDEARFRPISAAHILRLLRWLKPYLRLYVIGTLCGVVAIGCDLMVPRVNKSIIDTAIPSQDVWTIVKFAAIWLGLSVVSVSLDAVQVHCSNNCGERVIRDLRIAVFHQIQRLSMSFFDRTKLGRIITRGTSDMEALRGPVISGINMVAFNTLLMIGSALLILATDWRLFLAVAWLAPILAACNQIYRRKIGRQWQIVRAGFSRLSSNLAENITGMRVVSAFNRQEENLSRFNALQVENTANNLRAANLNGIYQPFLEFIRFCGQVIILGYGGMRVMAGELTAGDVIAVFFYWGMFMSPTITMGTFYNTLMQAMASCERIFALLDMQPEVDDLPGAVEIPRPKGHICFEHVTFGYNPERPVLHDICLDVPLGRTFALVGATGSGKSSTISLLCRFYDYQEGRILIDGREIREATLLSLRKQMGLVLQSNYLFAGTVLDNIRYSSPEMPEAQVHAAAQALDLHETFLALPNGYNTDVGERGASLSLGLRQLVCFTRVFAANPSIFLLDEATSSIDTITEMKVQSALEKLTKGRTTIIVAHRLSTIVKADCIVVLEQGRIIERGKHLDLLAAGGHYAMLYRKFVAHQFEEGPVVSPAPDSEPPAAFFEGN